MTKPIHPYTKRMYDAENEYTIYADIVESLYKEFKIGLIDFKIKQKKAVAEALRLWLDHKDSTDSQCVVCGKSLEYTGFLIYSAHTYESAVNALKHTMICDNPECTIMFEMKHDLDNYNKLKEQFGTDQWDFCDAIWKSWEQNK